MILIIDNYDSFVETLARYVREAGHATKVVRNDALSVEEIVALAPRGIIISPGPYGPAAAGVSRHLPGALPDTPQLGVCLGHLAIAEAYGGKTIAAREPVHGRATPMQHESGGLFQGVPNRFDAARYHALLADIAGTDLVPDVWSEGGELMSFHHPEHPHFGVQFHPESVLTKDGRTIIVNYVEHC